MPNKISQDAMNLSVMNQKVQRKMGGGGAKSKNAPKFTEAFTQGLGPMLYGAARGTAAGLAGIGGDIEELARLGINYAGDKLQSRFPNMLDKRDVVGAKATLPTSEVVLSKIPSLKDFGAGPEARHSEDIAAKLGMYGLSNIASPKAGKAVVQGVNATGKALAPKAGQMLENYMMRSGMALPMDVWHGSPHRFPPTAKNPLGEFDASKIGTGEGAQAYGHGHYLAEAKDVGVEYAKNLANRDIANQGRLNAHANAQRLAAVAGDAKYAADDIRFVLGNDPNHAQKQLLTDTLGFLESGAYAKPLANPGSLYKVDLPDEQIAKMLDWDKPLGGQHPDVQAALAKIDKDTYHPQGGDYGADEQGQMIYMRLANSPLAKTYADASELLRSAGIPGIRYLDQGSRGASGTGKWRITYKDGKSDLYDFKPNDDVLKTMGATAKSEGTSNFVVFPGNEEMLKILSREKDGGLVHGKKNGGEAKKPFSNDFERRQQMAGSVMPSQREMEEALSPATVNFLLKRAADRRQRKAMQEEPERPEMLPEAEVWPYDPTFRQQGSAKIQQGLKSIGFPIPRARSIAENIMGDGGTGVLDFLPVVGTPMLAQETKRNVERARDKGDQTGVVTELGLGALNTAASLLGTKALAKALASRIKPRTTQIYSQAEYDRILREGAPKQLSAPPAPPKLLNGPKEQRLLNAPAREKTVFEMQQELAQKNAMLPKRQYGLELPAGNTAAQRLEAMGFTEPGYHATGSDILKVDPSYGGKNDYGTIGQGFYIDPSKNASYANLVAKINAENSPQLIMPLRYNPNNLYDITDMVMLRDAASSKLATKNLKKAGYSGTISNVGGKPNEIAMFDPDDIRSRFAAFDPWRRNAAIAAATGSVAPDLLAEEYANGGEVTSDDLILIERKR